MMLPLVKTQMSAAIFKRACSAISRAEQVGVLHKRPRRGQRVVAAASRWSDTPSSGSMTSPVPLTRAAGCPCRRTAAWPPACAWPCPCASPAPAPRRRGAGCRRTASAFPRTFPTARRRRPRNRQSRPRPCRCRCGAPCAACAFMTVCWPMVTCPSPAMAHYAVLACTAQMVVPRNELDSAIVNTSYSYRSMIASSASSARSLSVWRSDCACP